MQRQVYDITTQIFGSEEVRTLTRGHNLACGLIEWDESTRNEGFALLRDIYERGKKVLGNDHQNELITAHSLIYFLENYEAPGEALALCEQVLEAAENGPREDILDTLYWLENVRRHKSKLEDPGYDWDAHPCLDCHPAERGSKRGKGRATFSGR